MLGWVVRISASSWPTFFSPLHRALMIFNRIGADMTRNTSAASSNTSSASRAASVLAGSAFTMVGLCVQRPVTIPAPLRPTRAARRAACG